MAGISKAALKLHGNDIALKGSYVLQEALSCLQRMKSCSPGLKRKSKFTPNGYFEEPVLELEGLQVLKMGYYLGKKHRYRSHGSISALPWSQRVLQRQAKGRGGSGVTALQQEDLGSQTSSVPPPRTRGQSAQPLDRSNHPMCSMRIRHQNHSGSLEKQEISGKIPVNFKGLSAVILQA